MLDYDYPVYRPPSEAESLIFQITSGCSYNKCSFCDMYRSKQYYEKSLRQIKTEILEMSNKIPKTRRIFLADGDALNIKTETMIEILGYLYEKFSELERVSCYAMPMNLLKKNNKELKDIHNAGLQLLYLGIESGSNVILKKITKGATHDTIIRACTKAKKSGYELSCMVILGLGGKKYTIDHITKTATILNSIAPKYVGALTLNLENGIKNEFLAKFDEEFVPIEDNDALNELELLIKNIDTKDEIIFRANHASNAYSIKGTFPSDKKDALKQISWLKEHPESSRPIGFRGF